MEDPSTTPLMKQFLKPIWDNEGPSGSDHFSTFAKDTRKFVREFGIQNQLIFIFIFFLYFYSIDNELFANFMSALADVCDNPDKRSYARQMIIELCRGVGLHNTHKGLHAK